MKRTDLAYIAGIIDGEGTITLRPRKGGNQKRLFQLMVTVANTNEWLIQWLHFAFGGTCFPIKDYGSRNHKQCWQWAIYAIKALEFLKLVYPYLRLKKPQADLAIKFQEGRNSKRHRLTEEEMAIAEVQKIMFTALNKRGK